MSGTQEAPRTRRPSLLSRLLTLALIVLAIAFLVRSFAPQTLGETARRQLLAMLQDHYREYSVSIRRGYFDPDIGLVFEDLRIADPSPSNARLGRGEMLRIERLTVVADIHPENLIEKRIPLLKVR